jgi:hypothetical protein
MYGQYLMKPLLLYLAIGSLMSLLLWVNVTVVKHGRGLEAMMDTVRVVGEKKAQIQKDTEQISARIREFDGLLPGLPAGSSDRELLLLGVDGLESDFPGDSLLITDIREGDSEVALPIELTFAFDGYYGLLHRLDYLEGRMFPFFRFNSLSFSKVPSDSALCTITGELIMPSGGVALK